MGKTRVGKIGGRAETKGVIEGDYALSVGMPEKPAPLGWNWTKLTNLARLESGHTPSRKHPEYWGGSVPWIGIKDAAGNHGQTIKRTNQYTNELGIENSAARILPRNTVCLSRTASVGYVVVMGCPMATSQDFVNWVCDPDKIHYEFLKYILLSEKRSFLRFASGTTHQTIYFPEVKAFHVCLPKVDEQRKIAHFLSTFDNKIELNRRINATLKSMSQAIFKSWFVDFDPVIDNALATGTTIPEALLPRVQARQELGDQKISLSPAIQQLFPNQFIFDEELGWIPKGWDLPQFKEFTVESKAKVGELEAPEYSSTNNGLVPRDEAFKKQLSKSKSKNKYVQRGDIVFGMSRQVLNFGVMYDEIGSVSSAYKVFRIDTKKIFPQYVETYIRMREHIYFNMLGSSSREGQSLSTSSFLHTRMLIPPRPLQDAFRSYGDFGSRLQHLESQTNSVSIIRDMLLPKLLSGELRIPDAEKLVGEVT